MKLAVALFFALLSIVSVSAKTFNVAVGDNNALVFNPPSISGAVTGDQIVFTFKSKNHTVTQSTFANPCVKASAAAVDSGFKPASVTSHPKFTVILDVASTSSPLWFFCAQTKPANHCHAGMVFAVNPTAGKTFAQFQANAKNSPQNPPATTTSGAPPTSTSKPGAVHTVLVGLKSTLTFTPPNIQAKAGDTIAFTFVSKNHSVTQSTFNNPCTLAPGGVNSGFQFIPPNSTTAVQWSITLDAESAASPLWFFCAQTKPANHCHTGMVFAINPTATKTFAQFQNNAKNAGGSSGGSISSSGTTSSGTTSSSGTATSSASSTTASSTPSSTRKPSNAAPGLRGSANIGFVMLVIGLVTSLSL